MPRQLRQMTSKRYLTHDEIVEIPLRGQRCDFRLRIWRGQEYPVIVLASQLAGGASPSWGSARLANLAYQVYLGFPTECVLNFEDEIIHDRRRLFYVRFTPFGHDLRRQLARQVRQAFSWADLEAMVGGAIENPP